MMYLKMSGFHDEFIHLPSLWCTWIWWWVLSVRIKNRETNSTPTKYALLFAGSMKAACELVTLCGGRVSQAVVVTELTALNGRQKLSCDVGLYSLLKFWKANNLSDIHMKYQKNWIEPIQTPRVTVLTLRSNQYDQKVEGSNTTVIYRIIWTQR